MRARSRRDRVVALQGGLMLLPESALRHVPRRGHAAAPGTGPEGERCATCAHIRSVFGGTKIFSKCGLAQKNWTRGSASDISKLDPACHFWTAKP